MTLNDAQQRAVEHFEGPASILAAPGSGKTRVVTHRCARLLERGVTPEHILVCTFTNRAARELKSRLAELVGGLRAKRLWVGTMHGLCVRLLRGIDDTQLLNGRTKRFVIYDDDDQEGILQTIIVEMDLDRKTFKAGRVRSWLSRQKSENKQYDDIEEMHETLGVAREIWRRYEAELIDNNAFDFDDLIQRGMVLAQSDTPEGKALRQRFQHVMVDEYQDTNVPQYRLVQALASSGNLVVCGDIFQSVYSFRGADIRNIQLFNERYEGAQTVFLDTCYRSTQSIVRFCDALMRPQQDRTTQTPHELGTRPRIVQCSTQFAEGDFVAATAQHVHLGHNIRYGQIAVLYRTRSHLRGLEDAIIDANIPYRVLSGTSFFGRTEIKDMVSYLRLCIQPRSAPDFKRICNKPRRGIGDKTLAKIQRYAKEHDLPLADAALVLADNGTLKGKAAPQARALRHLLRQAPTEQSPSDIALWLMRETGYRRMWVNHMDKVQQRLDAKKADPGELESAQLRLDSLDRFVEIIRRYEKRVTTPTVESFLEHIALIAAQDDIVEEEDKLLLMTCHAAKGLEFNVVFVVGVEDELGFPFASGGDALDPGSNPAEERRLLYVACSRAREHLYLSYCLARTWWGKPAWPKPSPFLFDVPDDLCIWPQREDHETKPVDIHAVTQRRELLAPGPGEARD